jgi:multiple sugar transport system substrate-binding protein
VSGFGIYPRSKNTDLAWEYIKELASVESQKGWVKVGAAVPALRSVAETPEFTKFPPNAKEYYGSIQYAKPVNAPTVFNVLEPSFTRAMDSIMSGTDPAAALKKASDEVDNAFKTQ